MSEISNKQTLIKKSVEEGKSLKQLKESSELKEKLKTPEVLKKIEPKKKASVIIEDMPLKGIKPENGTITLEITPEMTEALVMGILDTIALLAPQKFKAPDKKHGELLKMPAFAVIQRWMPQLDLLKYLPEIILATSFVSVMKDLKINEVKK